MINIFILAIGEFEYKKHSLDILCDFFCSIDNIEIFIIENELNFNIKNAHPSWLKLISHKYVNNDNFTLCWDLDLLPRNKSVKFNLTDFDISKINMCYDTSFLLKHQRFNNNFYFNGGLIGIPKNKRKIMESIYLKNAPGILPSYEQYYLNDYLSINKEPINILHPRYNTLYHNGELFNKSDFLHYTWQCNLEQKIFYIKKHHEKYFKTSKNQ